MNITVNVAHFFFWSLQFWRLECKIDIFQTEHLEYRVVASGETVSECFEMMMIEWPKAHHSDRLYVTMLNVMVKVMVEIFTFMLIQIIKCHHCIYNHIYKISLIG